MAGAHPSPPPAGGISAGSPASIVPRVYVVCLAAYVAGRAHGAWIDAHQEPEALWADVERLLAASPVAGAEEYAIHDAEGFGSVRIEEHASMERIGALAAFIVEHGEALGGAVLAHVGGDLDEASAAFEDYAGCYASLADFAEELAEDTIDIPEPLRFYIDYEAMARDMEINGDVFTVGTGYCEVHIFWSR